MQIKHFDCQGCNNHCPLTVFLDNYEIIEVKGNCCHRGLVSAKTQVEALKEADASLHFTGTKNMYCKSCANHCPVQVFMENGQITNIKTDGCRRAIVSIKRQLNL
jgi:CxxC motif-containing protein